MKKAISTLVSFIIVLTSIVGFSSTAFAKTIEGECGDNASFVYDYDTKTLTISGTGAIGDYSRSPRPWDYDEEEDVTHNVKIKNLIIKEGITSVSDYLFYNQGLKSVKFPSTLTSIGKYSFALNNSLKNVKLPKKLKTIGDKAFLQKYNKKQKYSKSVTIPKSVKKIGKNAFGYSYDYDNVLQKFLEPSEQPDNYKIKGFKIYGKKGSTAQKYAKKHKITFVVK